MIDTELRPAEPIDHLALSAGRGGDGWWDDDSGDDWGWSEDPDDVGSGYRRPRVIRAVALATVVAVIVGSVGTWVVFLAAGSPQASFAVSSIHVAGSRAGSDPSARVRFAVVNTSNQASPAWCRATVVTKTTVVGSGSSPVPRLMGGQSASVTISVPLDGSALVGHGLATTRVDCRATPTTAR